MKVIGTITRVSEGVIGPGKQRAGQTWQSITVEGLRCFVPSALQNGWANGQRVKLEVSHQGDKWLQDGAGKTLGYEPEYQLLSIERVVIPD